MVDIESKKAEASFYDGEKDCYIHVTMKNGEVCEILVAGNGFALVYGLSMTVHRISKILGGDPHCILSDMEKMIEQRNSCDTEGE